MNKTYFVDFKNKTLVMERSDIDKLLVLLHSKDFPGTIMTQEAYNMARSYMTLEDLNTHRYTPIDPGFAAYLTDNVMTLNDMEAFFMLKIPKGRIRDFIKYDYGDGSGYGFSYGYSHVSGDGDGSGDCYGFGYEDGDGCGCSYSDGDGLGDGDGDDSGDGYGFGYEDGDGDGCGCGYGDGDGDGDGSGDGDGDGYGSGSGSGSGSGYVPKTPHIDLWKNAGAEIEQKP